MRFLLVAALVFGFALPVCAQSQAASGEQTTVEPMEEVADPLRQWKLMQLSIAALYGPRSHYSVNGESQRLSVLFGLTVRFEVAPLRFLTLGPGIGLRGANLTDFPSSFDERLDASWFDVGASVRFRIPYVLKDKRTLLEPYVAVMPAFTIALSPFPIQDRVGLGWAVTTSLGLRMLFGRVGWLFEGGWEIHRVDFDEADTRLTNGFLQLGVVLGF